MAKLKNSKATGCKQRALKARASAGTATISRFRATQDIAQAFNEALGRDTVMADDPNAAPSQAAETPPRTAPDRAAHARAVKAEKHAHRKEVHDLRVQQAAHARSCKPAKLTKAHKTESKGE